MNVKAARACNWQETCIQTQPTKAAAGPGYNPAPGSLASGCWPDAAKCAKQGLQVVIGVCLIATADAACGVVSKAVEGLGVAVRSLSGVLGKIVGRERSLAGIDRGDGRDVFGRFTGKGGYGASAQAQGLADYTTATGRSVISNQVRATLPDGSIRYYDGLSLGPDGTYQGVEVKSGTAGLTSSQRAFDSQVDGGTSAVAMLNGSQISITSTYLVRVP